MISPDRVDNITSREDFVQFVLEMSRQFREGSAAWANRDLGDFLEALAGWVPDMDAFYVHNGLSVPDNPDRRTFAAILAAVRIYE